jgi:hypothetical protein
MGRILGSIMNIDNKSATKFSLFLNIIWLVILVICAGASLVTKDKLAALEFWLLLTCGWVLTQIVIEAIDAFNELTKKNAK